MGGFELFWAFLVAWEIFLAGENPFSQAREAAKN
jgi:hypothetical protein